MATVYKTLETLAEHNLISKLNAHHDLARFDGITAPHHHMICIECKKIVDVFNDRFNKLPFPTNANFKVFGYQIQFKGVCETCQLNPANKNRQGKNKKELTFCGKEKN